MYTNPQTGTTAAATAAPQATQLAAHRKAIEGLLATSEVISDQEFRAAAQRVNACHSLETLQKWYRNCVREIACREEATEGLAPVAYATAAQKQEIVRLANRVAITRPEKTQALLRLNSLNVVEAGIIIGRLWAWIVERAGTPAPGQRRALGGKVISFNQ